MGILTYGEVIEEMIATQRDLTEDDGGTERFTANALEEAPGGGGATADVNVVSMAADVITAAAHDESTAFPIKSADTGATEIARTGADGDTLETISDEIAVAQADLDLLTGVDGATLATLQANYAPAVVGDAMSLEADAITASVYDETTAFPVVSADTGATEIARTGADGDTLETISDEIAVAQADLDLLTGVDGATLATLQANYAPSKAGDAMDLVADAVDATSVADDAIDAATLATDLDTYQAKVWLIDDDGAGTPTDRYVIAWYKNAEPIVAGITSPTIQVIKASDGTDLVGVTAMTQAAATGLYRYDEITNRVVDGAVYFAKCQATIAASTRTWYQPVGRDSA